MENDPAKSFFDWIKSGKTGCLFAKFLAKQPAKARWQSATIYPEACEGKVGLLMDKTLQATVGQYDTLQFLFPTVRSEEHLAGLLEELSEHPAWSIRCRVDLRTLFQNQRERETFEGKWNKFLTSDRAFTGILTRGKNHLAYLSEEIISTKHDPRPPLVLLFGNPAPHSVNAGVMFSFEGSGKEHRIWQVLREAKLLSFPNHQNTEPLTNEARNIFRRDSLLQGHYNSPFRLALLPFFTLPTTSSAPPWCGVAGIWRLFGKHAAEKLANAEAERIRHTLGQFMPQGGTIITFQKDAFRFLGGLAPEQYSLRRALSASLSYRLNDCPSVRVFAAPPTRLLRSSNAKLALGVIKRMALGKRQL